MPDSDDPFGEVGAQLRVRALARDRLAGELHDELTHRVASISLQVMGHRGSDDIAQLRRSMDTIAAATADVLAHLWLLERVLRAQPFDPDRPRPEPGSGLPNLAVCDPVAEVVERQAQALRAAGFSINVRVPDHDEEVGPLARRTVEEAVAVARETIDRHATPGGRCTIEVTTAPGSVSLTVTAQIHPDHTREGSFVGPRGGPVTDDAMLAALHERVRLTEGIFWAGHVELQPGSPTWSLALRLRDR